MASNTTTKPAAAAHPQTREDEHSALYRRIMTPINFVTFLVSLYLVDYHYNSKREHTHDHNKRASRLPGWLHSLLFKPQPYAWVGGGDSSAAPPNQDDKNWYYHTKQKKLMKMEAAAAFEMRRSVTVALVFIAVGAAWGLSRLLAAAASWWWSV
ncbi:hypothetical protein PFICI_01881 [Pestalotiopsis fici W106-1]|uniref:Uncharacterized protein n=1 Tax=Pestalotiopsis fici (strain W106-1 / CGMCC3.15140) TaxID=1229662 RepID=W3XPR7_PESFW|nr:uncharacterized protein PFICI_01881 [Pestalotiopsis fici W106-1]ETS88053.1 hypothetical protein PFICI_01881 [Pestalotiopsis fici W106-1]